MEILTSLVATTLTNTSKSSKIENTLARNPNWPRMRVLTISSMITLRFKTKLVDKQCLAHIPYLRVVRIFNRNITFTSRTNRQYVPLADQCWILNQEWRKHRSQRAKCSVSNMQGRWQIILVITSFITKLLILVTIQ